MAAASGVLYVTESWRGVIYSCPATGCSGTPAICAHGSAKIMKAGKKGLFWISDSGVDMCPLPDCDGGPRELAVNQLNSVDLAITDRYIVWANAGDPNVALSGSIMRLDR